MLSWFLEIYIDPQEMVCLSVDGECVLYMDRYTIHSLYLTFLTFIFSKSVTEQRSKVSRFASDLQQCVWTPLPLLVLRIKEATNHKTLQVL